MVRVLITGANSYVGTNLQKWLMKDPTDYYTETLDMKDPNWRHFDFSRFDVVFHVAGLVHKNIRKVNKQAYYTINTNLTAECAKKAYSSGVRHFIFMSTMSVYNPLERIITVDSKPRPANDYGLSKLLAEQQLFNDLNKNDLTIIRAPIIYGKNSPGNFERLIKLLDKLPIFPDINNKRSMIFIDNLCGCIKKIIDCKITGIVHVQNPSYVSTTNLVKILSKVKGKKIVFTRVFNFVIILISKLNSTFRKMFMDHYYDLGLTKAFDDCVLIELEESIQMTIDNE
ncbi:MAG TPA: NAD-dependent epimerase/dehydratase family protein [Bacilli bacterium]|nr:NAD-dependent epimerase/dehydratase family protein [Bacilli bacterium]